MGVRAGVPSISHAFYVGVAVEGGEGVASEHHVHVREQHAHLYTGKHTSGSAAVSRSLLALGAMAGARRLSAPRQRGAPRGYEI